MRHSGGIESPISFFHLTATTVEVTPSFKARTCWASSSMFFSVDPFAFVRSRIHRGGAGKRADKPVALTSTALVTSRECFKLSFPHFIFIRVFRAYWLKTSWSKSCFYRRPALKRLVSPSRWSPFECATHHAGNLLNQFVAGGRLPECWWFPILAVSSSTGVSQQSHTFVLYVYRVLCNRMTAKAALRGAGAG